MSLLPYALAAARRGWPVFPLTPASKKPPLVKDWERAATTDPARIRAWWQRWPAANYGIATGPASLVVVDLDVPKPQQTPPATWALPGVVEGADVLAVLAEQAGQPLPLDTFTVRTRRGGTHLYFTHPHEGPRLGNTSGDQGAGLGWLIDTRAHGGYVVGPGCPVRAADGTGSYEVLDRAVPAPLPEWIRSLLRRHDSPDRPTASGVPSRGPVPDVFTAITTDDRRRAAYVRAAVTGELARVREAPPHTRNTNLYIAAASLGQFAREGLLDPGWIADALHNAATASGARDTPSQITTTIRSGLAKGLREPRRTRTPPGRTAA
ncbi:Bifunctional DNA primase/polymerase, N-terminal [Nocardiopsis flavescens]|uniref:Bifunctional DNA primase/polymerase, N-terminal n=1 Tax=Nocardiopsis flavescens TaxID=758803 RepID=A0A1M6RD79_9ACTN|nr:bifunctional DNA primase/polymerase [Nocardiopsis flavescens]SHK30419.1 Bifunctional DNA primase/polymerase, N-terminal [Nocardiopsis flavescens]